MGSKLYSFTIAFVSYIIFLCIIYLFDSYAGFLMNLIFGSMIVCVLIISVIAELIQKSKVTPIFFWALSGCIIASFVCIFILRYNLSQ